MAESAAAQSLVRGRLEHAPTGTPVRGAVVELLGSFQERFAATVSDSLGAFAMVAPGPGEYRVRVVHADYDGIQSETLLVGADGATVDLVLYLGIKGYELAPLEVRGRAQTSQARFTRGRDSFDAHRLLGKGRFLTAEDLEAMNLPAVSHLLLGEEGFIPLAMPDGTVSYRPLWGWSCLRTVVNGLWNSQMPTIRTFVSGREAYRTVEAMVEAMGTPDRTGMRELRSRGIDDLVLPEDIAGVEIFREANEVPSEWQREIFGAGISRCGVMMIWTKAAW